MKTYIAWVTNKYDDHRSLSITDSSYTSKKAFAEDLRRNGYAVHYIATPETLDEVSAKYNERRESRNYAARCARAAANPKPSSRYFYMSDIDSTMCVEICTKKEMIDLLDETIRFNYTDEECIFDIIYKDGSEIRIDENNRKYKKTGIAAIVNDNGNTVQVYGAFEINENGVVYPALTEKIDETLIEVDDWNYHAPTTEEIENMIAEAIENEYNENFSVPNLYRNEPDNTKEVREMLRSCSHIQYDWRRNHAVFYKHEREIGRAYNIDNMDLQQVARSLGKSYDRTW